jgi:aminoglycoside 2'-N-acetyltransferase I
MNSVPPIRQIRSSELSPAQRSSLRRLFSESWSGEGEFTEQDWNHAMGGMHFLVEQGHGIVAHAAVVARILHPGDFVLKTGYVEAVTTKVSHRRRGLGAAIMLAVGRHIDRHYELGALDTGQPDFYERFGWRIWQGPTFVRTEQGLERTEKEDGLVMIRLTPTSPALDVTKSVSCDSRPGDAW